MLVVETIGRIRREHFQKGKSIKEIARDLKISRNTVRKVLRSGETSFSYEREVQPRPKLGAWKTEIDRVLAAPMPGTPGRATPSLRHAHNSTKRTPDGYLIFDCSGCEDGTPSIISDQVDPDEAIYAIMTSCFYVGYVRRDH